MTTREEVLAALFARLQLIVGPLVQRGSVLPERVPPEGMLNLRDGDPGEAEVTMSPRTYHYEHVAEIEVVVHVASNRAVALDMLLEALGLVLSTDPTLGGACDWTEAEAPAPVDLPVAGGIAYKAAVIPVTLVYSTTGPLA